MSYDLNRIEIEIEMKEICRKAKIYDRNGGFQYGI